jgi:hypothetical protein
MQEILPLVPDLCMAFCHTLSLLFPILTPSYNKFVAKRNRLQTFLFEYRCMDILIWQEGSPPSSAGSPSPIYTVNSYIAIWYPKRYNDSFVNSGCGHFCILPAELMLLPRKLEARTIH